MENGLTDKWERIEYKGLPIYIRPELPDWFVPDSECDKLLTEWLKGGITSENGVDKILKRIEGPEVTGYRYRTDKLSLDHLKECWIHVTNKCNMECRHCMFSSSPKADEQLSVEECTNIVDEAYALGARIFYFTGGEPFISKAFLNSLKDILERENTHVVVLTNLTLIKKHENLISDLPKDRLHFQVSLDGLRENHDFMRGEGAFDLLKENLMYLYSLGFPVTLSTTVTSANVSEMEDIVDFASSFKVSNLHFLWLFKKGNADDSLYVEPDKIFENLMKAYRLAEEKDVKIDNIEIIKSQLFSCPGTKYNLSNAGWQSIAVGPDGFIYPTPALIYTEEIKCGHVKDGIENVWKKSSVLEEVRKASLSDDENYNGNPFKYIVGGGDIDHSFINSGKITGGDPYVELYNNIAKYLLFHYANQSKVNGYPGFKLRMGEILGDCPAEGSEIFFTHSNCVLSLPGKDTHTQVNHFYTEAAIETKEDILNPVCYDEHLVKHIPEGMRFRSYGCGSPVLEADVRFGETLVDLGSGTGIECFIASRLTGPYGKVIGIDMGDTMLGIAENTKKEVASNLKYDNVSFKKAFLEELPVPDNSVDVVISNCVINLSPNKRKVFQEILRVLKPNGRIFISDISYNGDIPLDIKYNETLRGECIGGALNYVDLFGIMNDIGFSSAKIAKGYLYRNVKGYDFYSITYTAVKPEKGRDQIPYDFPDFDLLMKDVESEPTCACFLPPESSKKEKKEEPHMSGCMVCGEDLVYSQTSSKEKCEYCGDIISTGATCKNGHFVCDTCHRSGAVEIIKQVCMNSDEKDAVILMKKVRSHRRFPIHGPEHHSLLPAVILTALRNSGEKITDEMILTAIERGQTIAGGACAFFGACGAAIGLGIAVSMITGATPLTGDHRQIAQRATMHALEKISSLDVPRCCQRDLWLALQAGQEFLKEKLGITLFVDGEIACDQFRNNKECIFKRCPLWAGDKED